MQPTPNFNKTLKQSEATKLMVGPQKHTMLFGGSRSGKTFNIIRAIIIRMCKTKSRHITLRQTFNSVKTSVFMDTLPKVLAIAFPNLNVEWNRTDFFIRTPNGSEYFFGGMDDHKRVEKHLGKEFSTIHFNECSQLAFSSVQLILTRLAEKNDLNKKVYYDQNPPAKSHWTYWQFVKKLNPVDNEPLNDPDNYESILMNPVDNMDNIDPDYLSMLESLPEKEKNRFLFGQYSDVDDGVVYYEFNRDVHVYETIVQQPGTIFIGMDFNVDPMTAVVGQVINNEFHIIDEVFLRNSDTPKMVNELKSRGYTGARLIPDSTGKNRKTSGQSDFDILKQHFHIENTFNPFVTDRVNNINRLFSVNRIKISSKCKKLISDLEKVAWKDNKLNQTGDAKLLTHISDCLGYLCWKLDPISGRPKTPIRKR
jgi:hypothetical protein